MIKMKEGLVSHGKSKLGAAEAKPAPARATTSTVGKGRIDDVDEYHARVNLSRTEVDTRFAISDEELVSLQSLPDAEALTETYPEKGQFGPSHGNCNSQCGKSCELPLGMNRDCQSFVRLPTGDPIENCESRCYLPSQ
jgi:hypothetical protein